MCLIMGVALEKNRAHFDFFLNPRSAPDVHTLKDLMSAGCDINITYCTCIAGSKVITFAASALFLKYCSQDQWRF